MKQLLKETFELSQVERKTKNGSVLYVYVDKNKSTDSPYERKETFKQYGMYYIPTYLENKKYTYLARYAPHAWGWVIWNNDKNDKQWSYINKFIRDLPNIESAPENGQERNFDNITGDLGEAIRGLIRDAEIIESIPPSNDAELQAAQKRVSEFKDKIVRSLDDEKTVEFIRQLVELRRRLVALKGKPLSWSNTLTAYFSRGGKISEIHSVGTWKDKGWIAKPGVAPFVLIGYDQKRIPYTSDYQKQTVITDFLRRCRVNSQDELTKTQKNELKNELKGKPIPGRGYFYSYKALDADDVIEDPEAKEIEPKAKDVESQAEVSKHWWDNAPVDEKDEQLTQALIAFASSNECGNIVVHADNTQEGLAGARGNATNKGVLNLVGDGKVRFPTGVHELLHSLKHWDYAMKNNPSLKRFYHRPELQELREWEAELCCLFIIGRYGYDEQPHINYLRSWELPKDMAGTVFDQVADVAYFIENGVIRYMEKMFPTPTIDEK
jgi:hypothetical protein